PIAVPVTVVVVVTIAALILSIIPILRLGGTATGSTDPKNKSERQETPANHFSEILHGMSPLNAQIATSMPICSVRSTGFLLLKNSQIFTTELQEHFPYRAAYDAIGRCCYAA